MNRRNFPFPNGLPPTAVADSFGALPKAARAPRLTKPKQDPPEPAKPALPALNIIYLIPTDREPLPDWERRLGTILLEMRNFYNRELRRNGSPAELRMPLDPKTGRVRLQVVRGSKPAADYPYEQGWRTAVPDIEKFAKEHPDRIFSDRYLVILPRLNGESVPFYGLGNYCFAIDYPGFDWKHCGEKSAAGRNFTKWYGGMAHELGHGLGLPHNHATVSQEKLFGEALMAAGNYTLGRKPTFLTPGSCALLESCPVCRVFEPKPLKLVNRFDLTKDVAGREVRIRGQLPRSCTVRRIVAAYDKDDFGDVNDNYDAESFVVPFDRDGRFDFVFPLSDIHPGRTKAFQVQLRFAHCDYHGTIELIRETVVPKGTK